MIQAMQFEGSNANIVQHQNDRTCMFISQIIIRFYFILQQLVRLFADWMQTHEEYPWFKSKLLNECFAAQLLLN